MSHCFAVGSRGNHEHEHVLHYPYIVEFLHYGIREVDISASFFVRNVSQTPTPMRFLHRGNIEFNNESQTVLRGTDPCTSTFFALINSYGKGKVTLDDKQKKAVLLECPNQPVQEFHLGHAATGKLNRLDPGPRTQLPTESHVPFSLYESAPIGADQSETLHIHGTLKGPSYEVMTMGGGSFFSIYGGEALTRAIVEDDMLSRSAGDIPSSHAARDISDYEARLREFENAFMTTPEQYHMIIYSSAGEHHPQVRALTPDLQLGCRNAQVGSYVVTWYWSRAATFYVAGWVNGHQLTVSVA